VKEVLGMDYAVPAFFEPGRRFWKGADCPTLCAKDVDGIAPSDCGARARAEPAVIIDAHNFA
jgi:hypothetical protein